MRYKNGEKIDISLYLFISSIVVLGSVLFFFIKDKEMNLGFLIIGCILMGGSIIVYFMKNKKEKKPYYQEKAKKKYNRDK